MHMEGGWRGGGGQGGRGHLSREGRAAELGRAAIVARRNFWRARANGMALYTTTEMDDAARLRREASRLEAGARRESRKRPAPDDEQGLVTSFATPGGAHPPESTPMKAPPRPQGPATLATAGGRRRGRRPQSRASRVARAAAVLAGLRARRSPARAPVAAAGVAKSDGGERRKVARLHFATPEAVRKFAAAEKSRKRRVDDEDRATTAASGAAEPHAPGGSAARGGAPRATDGLGGKRAGGAGVHASRMILAAIKANGAKAARIL